MHPDPTLKYVPVNKYSKMFGPIVHGDGETGHIFFNQLLRF